MYKYMITWEKVLKTVDFFDTIIYHETNWTP